MDVRILTTVITLLITGHGVFGGWLVHNRTPLQPEVAAAESIVPEALSGMPEIAQMPEMPGGCTAECCAQADSPLGSPAAKICCEVGCHRQTRDIPTQQPERETLPKIPPAGSTSPVCVGEAVPPPLVTVFHRSGFRLPAVSGDPPPLFLHNSAFLI